MMDPTIGRWTTKDPDGFTAEDMDLYRYCENDPTNETDPSGLTADPVDNGDYAKNWEEQRGLYTAIHTRPTTMKYDDAIMGKTYDAVNRDGVGVKFTFEKAYVGTFTNQDQKRVAGAYVKIVAHVVGVRVGELKLVQIVADVTRSSNRGWNRQTHGNAPAVIDPEVDYRRLLGGWGDPGTPYRGWFVDGGKRQKTPFYSTENGDCGFYGNTTKPAILYDAPNLLVCPQTREEGYQLITCAIGITQGVATFLGCVRWGFYIDKTDGEVKVDFDPARPVASPDAPWQLGAALDRWNGIREDKLRPKGVPVPWELPPPSPSSPWRQA